MGRKSREIVILTERDQRSGGTLRNPDIGCTDARSARIACSAGTPVHGMGSVGCRMVPGCRRAQDDIGLE